MNTDVTVTACGGDEHQVATDVAATFERAERRFSRFRSDSELSTLNGAEGPAVASPELFAVLQRAHGYSAMTGGIFDPAIGASLTALGYDRSFTPDGHGWLVEIEDPADSTQTIAVACSTSSSRGSRRTAQTPSLWAPWPRMPPLSCT